MPATAARDPAPPRGPSTVRYGADPDQVADLWLPTASGPEGAAASGHPVVVSIHGGYFQAKYRRDLHDPLSRRLAESGLAVLNIEYRRAGRAGSLEQTTDDVMAAITWLVSDSGRWKPGVSVVGHSAGGYLALWAASHPAVDLVIALAAASDLADCVGGGYDGGAVVAWLGARPEQDPARYEQADLARRLPTGATTWLVHGDADDTVPFEQSTRYAQQARQAGDDSLLQILPGQGHFGVIEPGSPAFEYWHRKLVERLAPQRPGLVG